MTVKTKARQHADYAPFFQNENQTAVSPLDPGRRKFFIHILWSAWFASLFRALAVLNFRTESPLKIMKKFQFGYFTLWREHYLLVPGCMDAG